jgi:hypothetical protein
MSKSKATISHQNRLARSLVLASAAIVSACAVFGLPALARAQQAAPAPQESGATIWQKGGCANCHGNLAAGDGDSAYPAGPNLRLTKLKRDGLIETISCGRPGTPMPFNLAGAYTQTPCYGIPLGPPTDVNRGAGFTAPQIAKLVDFLTTNVVGVTKITKENCAAFFDGDTNSPLCQQY